MKDDLVESAIAEVSGRFKDWQPNEAQLGYARAIGRVLIPLIVEECAKIVEGHVADYSTGEIMPNRSGLVSVSTKNLATAIRQLGAPHDQR